MSIRIGETGANFTAETMTGEVMTPTSIASAKSFFPQDSTEVKPRFSTVPL